MEQKKPTLKPIDKWTTEVTLPEGAVVTFARPNAKVKRMLLDDPEQRLNTGNLEEAVMASSIRSIKVPAEYTEGQDDEKTLSYDAADISNVRARLDELSICDLEAFGYIFTREVYPARALLEEAMNDVKKSRASVLGK